MTGEHAKILAPSGGSRQERLKVTFFPAIETQADAVLCERYARWGLAPLKPIAQIEVIARPEAMRQAFWPDYCDVIEGSNALACAKSADQVLVWRSDAFWGAPAWLRRKAVVCDPYISFAATDTLNAWVSKMLGLDGGDTAPPAFVNLRKACHAVGRDALLIGSGPSQAELLSTHKSALGNPLCIYMGAAIANEALIERFPPDIIVAADGASQFSALEAGLAYKARVEKIMEDSHCLLAVPAGVAGVISAHWPEALFERILKIPTLQSDTAGFRGAPQLHKKWGVAPTGNILTTLALPLAGSLSRCIRFAGITIEESPEGAKGVHWRQARAASYAREVASILANEPGAVLPKSNYRAEHFGVLQSMLAALKDLDVELYDVSGQPLDLASHTPAKAGSAPDAVKRAVRACIQGFAKVQHFPEVLGIFTMIAVLSLSMISLAFLQSNAVLLGAVTLGLVLIIGGVFFLRLRMNRMLNAMEGRLARQQATQFGNLSERLKALEIHTEDQSNLK